MSRFCFAAFLTACLVTPAVAQTVSGTITGTVVDSSSLPIPGASVTLKNAGTGLQQNQTTGSNGGFVFTAVLPGRYTIMAEMKGFKRVEKQNLNISAERLSAGDLMLPVGEVSESVTGRWSRNSGPGYERRALRVLTFPAFSLAGTSYSSSPRNIFLPAHHRT